MNALLNSSLIDDQKLIELHLAGDAKAFRQIVERYQGMVCALAYSACGDVARSEDVAQEVFIAAWKQLPQLRDPAKLRGWLCGITRNLLHNSLRRAGRTPTARADELSPDTPADTTDPRDHAIGADEAALMWGALGGLAETYREPMVLFYREGRSLAAVAEALEISEDTARQRLARGRAMLTERMAKLVEETLERSAPTPAFAATVLVLLPGPFAPTVIETLGGNTGVASSTLSAAGAMGSAVAKGGVVLKLLSALAFLPAIMQGAGDFVRFNNRNAALGDPSDRRQAAWAYLMMNLGIGLFFIGAVFVPRLVPDHSSPLIYVVIGLGVLGAVWLAIRAKCRMNRLAANRPAVVESRPGFEQRSGTGFLGLPFYHVRLGTRPSRRAPAVKAWIAISDGRAVGGLFAFGPVALAPVSMGIASIGLLSVGIVALGFGALGIVAAGWWSNGLAAFGGYAAKGIFASASQMASQNLHYAGTQGAAAAQAFFQENWFYRFTAVSAKCLVWAGLFGWVMPVALTGWQLWRTRRNGDQV